MRVPTRARLGNYVYSPNLPKSKFFSVACPSCKAEADYPCRITKFISDRFGLPCEAHPTRREVWRNQEANLVSSNT